MTALGTLDAVEEHLLVGALERVAQDLGVITDHELSVVAVEGSKRDHRPAGEGGVHISFKLGFRGGEARGEGCLLLPLPEAAALADFLMMVPEEAVAAGRQRQTLDSSTKDAMLELGNFVAAAVAAAAEELGVPLGEVRSEGCQGVRAGVRPALDYEEGARLLVGRARMRLAAFPEFEALLLLPELASLAGG